MTMPAPASMSLRYYLVFFPASTFQFVHQDLGLEQPLDIRGENTQASVLLTLRLPADMWRDEAVPRLPQRVVLGQRLRIRHVQRRTPDLALGQGLDERRAVDDGPAGNIHHERLPGAEDLELRLADQPLGGPGQRQRDDEHVEVLREEAVDVVLCLAVQPAVGQLALRVAHAGQVEGAVAAGLGGVSGRGREGYDFHSQGLAEAGDLAAYGTVTQNAPGRFYEEYVSSIKDRSVSWGGG